MTGTELTIITAVFFILSALGAGYAQRKAANHCLERIEGLLIQIKDDAQAHHNLVQESIDNVGSNVESSLASVWGSLNDLDMALHGDWEDSVEYKQKLNPLKQIEESLEGHRENLETIRSFLSDIHTALEPARLRAERRLRRNINEFANMVDGASCGQLRPEQLLF
ncbi:MAG: hypothetical protein WCA23_06935 [Stellaceae bacterium]